MYKKIRSMETQPVSYSKKLVKAGIVTEAEVQQIRDQINTHFESEYQASLSFKPSIKDTTDPNYRGSRSLTHKWADYQFS